LDGSDVMLAHYCAMLNQPRMVLVPGGDANKLVFQFEVAFAVPIGDKKFAFKDELSSNSR
jgi:hypothetical protein